MAGGEITRKPITAHKNTFFTMRISCLKRSTTSPDPGAPE
jgi:hypothetical protein